MLLNEHIIKKTPQDTGKYFGIHCWVGFDAPGTLFGQGDDL